MAKSKRNVNRKQTNRTPKSAVRTTKVRARTANSAYGFDKVALDYMRLIRDPCNAPLCHSVSPITGAFVSRYATEYTLTSGGAATDFGIFVSPGDCMNNAGVGGLYYGAAAVGVNLVLTTVNLPGLTTLASMAGSFKPIAACIDLRWGGTELNRAGLVGKFATSGKLVEIGDSVTGNGLLSNCFSVDRMPSDHITLRWKPNILGDTGVQDPSTTVTSAATSGHRSQFGLVIPAVAAGQVLYYRITMVYEWSPRNDNRQPISPYVQSSKVPYSTIVQALDSDVGWLDRLERGAEFAIGAWNTGKRIMQIGNTLAPMLLTV